MINRRKGEYRRYGGLKSGGRMPHTWRCIMHRCYNEKNAQYHYYGGRGIKVCDEWHDFACFYKDMGEPPNPKMSIDRIDNEKGYSPENCRWATNKEQARNKSTSSIFNGVVALDKSIILGGNKTLVTTRLKRGWKLEEAFTSPLRRKLKNKNIKNI